MGLSSSQTLGLPHGRGRMGVRGWAEETPSTQLSHQLTVRPQVSYLTSLEPMVLECAL